MLTDISHRPFHPSDPPANPYLVSGTKSYAGPKCSWQSGDEQSLLASMALAQHNRQTQHKVCQAAA